MRKDFSFVWMDVYRQTENLPAFKNAVITVGTFDGVHVGHKQIIDQLKREAKETNGASVIVTFHPHPRTIVVGKTPVGLLNTIDEKIALLAETGIDKLVIVDFNESFASQEPEAYIKDFLFEKFHPHTVIIGYDHKFGKARAGDYHLLETYAKQLGFLVKEIPEKFINESIVSSTLIRKALLQHDIESANKCLGYAYFFEGVVVGGNKLGRTLGYPTANIKVQDAMKLIPANGIYVASAELKDDFNNKRTLKGMLSIGTKPTVTNENIRTIELNIFDFDEDIYGKNLKVILHKFLREEVKFNSMDELIKQMADDKLNSLQYFSNT